MAESRRSSQRYLSGRVKIAGTESLYSDRHLYVQPGQVEPNLGYPGEKDIPLSGQYYQLVTIENGGVFDRYWQAQSGLEPGGVTIFDEGIQVGLANSVTKLNNKFNNYNETRLVYYCCTWVRSYTKMIYLSNKIYNVKLQAKLL